MCVSCEKRTCTGAHVRFLYIGIVLLFRICWNEHEKTTIIHRYNLTSRTHVHTNLIILSGKALSQRVTTFNAYTPINLSKPVVQVTRKSTSTIRASGEAEAQSQEAATVSNSEMVANKPVWHNSGGGATLKYMDGFLDSNIRVHVDQTIIKAYSKHIQTVL